MNKRDTNLTKRNNDLSEQLNYLKNRLLRESKINIEVRKKLISAISNIQDIQTEWYKNINELNYEKEQYKIARQELEEIKNMLNTDLTVRGLKMPLRRKLFWRKQKILAKLRR